MCVAGEFEPPRRNFDHRGVLTASVVGLCLATSCLLGHVRTEPRLLMLLFPTGPRSYRTAGSSGEVSSTGEKCFIGQSWKSVSCPKKDSYWWGLRQSMRHEISMVVIDEVGSIPALATAVPTVMNWGRPEWGPVDSPTHPRRSSIPNQSTNISDRVEWTGAVGTTRSTPGSLSKAASCVTLSGGVSTESRGGRRPPRWYAVLTRDRPHKPVVGFALR